MTRLRVLHVSPYFAPAFRYGGPPRSILGLCQGLQQSGVEVEVLTTAADGPTDLPQATDGRYDGVPVQYVPTAFPRRFFGAHMAAPLAEALSRTDLCHIHGIWNVPEWSAARLARRHHVPYVVSPRGMLLPAALGRGRWRKRIAYEIVERGNLRRAALLHATSDEEADRLRSLVPHVPVVVVPNGVDVDAARRAAPDFRPRLGIPADAFVIVFLGRMHRIKRLDLLAEAFADLRGRHAHAHLVLAGPDEENILSGIRDSLKPHAGFVHTLETLTDDEKWALLKSADASVQCSDSESFGLAVVEALAAGTPVVVTRTCPWAEIESRRCGFWVEQTPAAIARALSVLVEDPAGQAAMGERGAAFARERFSWRAIGRQMSDHYAGLVTAGADAWRDAPVMP
ncbi:MAG: glycosyltransferase [Vicinamibacterales bacterium]